MSETNSVERPPVPVCWRREWDGDQSDFGAYVHADDASDLDGSIEQWEPLYTKEAIDAAVAADRKRVTLLLAAVREHWVKANGEDSLSVGALDVIAEVIADGSYVESGPNQKVGG